MFGSPDFGRGWWLALALLVPTPTGLAAQDGLPAGYRGDWVPATTSCQSPLRFRVSAARFALINARDSASYGDVHMATGTSYFGPDYTGIQAVGIPEFNGDQPFRATFNAEEKKGVTTLEIYTPMPGPKNPGVAAIEARAKRLSQRFPLHGIPLKLCPGPAAPAREAAASLCQGRSGCSEIAAMAISVEDFRITSMGGARYATAMLRLTNKGTAPLTLGYVQGSGLVTDDRGNRYRVSGPVRGLGEITGNTFDPKFTLQPGEAGDARFEFAWSVAQQQLFGTVFAMDLALRDIIPQAGEQYRLGQERSWRWTGLTDMTAGSAAVSEPAAPAGAGTSAPSREAIADPCEGAGPCSFASPVSARVMGVTVTKASGYQFVKLNLRIQNLGAQPVVLCYASGSAVGSDDRGNRYAVRDDRVQGIGICRGGSADPQFALQAGQSRDATVEYAVGIYRGTILGTIWSASLTARELDLLAGNQIRVGRELVLSFRDLNAEIGRDGQGVAPAAPAASGDACGDQRWCDDTGVFLARVNRVTPTKASGYQFVGLAIKVTNRLNERLVLCYLNGSASGSDDEGNRYAVRNDRVRGIGICTGNSANPQFVLEPGQSRDWSIDYHVGIYRGTVLGTQWTAGFTLRRLQPLPGNQLQTVGDYSVSFEELAAQGSPGAAGVVDGIKKLIKKP